MASRCNRPCRFNIIEQTDQVNKVALKCSNSYFKESGQAFNSIEIECKNFAINIYAIIQRVNRPETLWIIDLNIKWTMHGKYLRYPFLPRLNSQICEDECTTGFYNLLLNTAILIYIWIESAVQSSYCSGSGSASETLNSTGQHIH